MATTGNGMIIAAIPSRDDYVWRISSEKVPHLTLLYLGEQVDNVAGITEYLEHVAKTSMNRFGMSVDRRGELGDNKADVLFFADYNVKMLRDIRSHLLKNEDVYRAYHSATQFPEFVPHLTLGYPETPAKPDNRDYPGIHWVNFDRIALWTDDYEGPEFVLKEFSSELEMHMSDSIEDVIAHYGVKGMQWGVRRTRKQIDNASDDHRNASAARAKIKKHGTKSLSNKELKDVIERMNLEQQYNRLAPPSTLRRGARVATDILSSVGRTLAKDVVTAQVSNLIPSPLTTRR